MIVKVNDTTCKWGTHGDRAPPGPPEPRVEDRAWVLVRADLSRSCPDMGAGPGRADAMADSRRRQGKETDLA